MEQFSDHSATVAVVCGTLSIVVLISFLVVIWILWAKQRSGQIAWPWRRGSQEPDVEAARSSSSTTDSSAGDLKSAASGSQHAVQPHTLAVVVVHPGDQLDLGTTDTPTAGASCPAAPPPAPEAGDAPVGLVVTASQQLVLPTPAAQSATSSESLAARREAAAVRAAYLTELEEREAHRRELQRRSVGYGSLPSSGWAMSFLPYIM